MELLKNGGLELEKKNISLGTQQKAFLDTTLGKAVNLGIDAGIRISLPKFLEEDAIKIKDVLLTEGFKSAINTAINGAINLGKNVEGIFTGNFENISQIKQAISSGGLLENISDLLDSAINFAKNEKYISSSTAKEIKKYKNKILESVEESIESELNKQVEAIEKINKYVNKWKEGYEEQNFDKMENQYKQIEKYMEKIIPIENLINEVREIENLHTLIKNNDRNFNITEEEKILAKILK